MELIIEILLKIFIAPIVTFLSIPILLIIGLWDFTRYWKRVWELIKIVYKKVDSVQV